MIEVELGIGVDFRLVIELGVGKGLVVCVGLVTSTGLGFISRKV